MARTAVALVLSVFCYLHASVVSEDIVGVGATSLSARVRCRFVYPPFARENLDLGAERDCTFIHAGGLVKASPELLKHMKGPKIDMSQVCRAQGEGSLCLQLRTGADCISDPFLSKSDRNGPCTHRVAAKVKVHLHTPSGLLKSSTECAPNGYYFLRIYDEVGLA